MKNEVLKLDPKEYGLDVTKAASIEQSFLPKIAEREGYEKVYAAVIEKELTPETCAEAKVLRNKLVKVRTGIAEIHKTEKAFYFQAGKFVDALKNKLTLPVTQMEEKLSEIENHFENIERERIEKLQSERVGELLKYTDDIHGRDLGSMDSEVWDAFIMAKKQQHTDLIAAEQQREKDRIAQEKKEAEEREAQRLENERLKKEAAERETKIEAERKERERLAKIEQDKREKEDAERRAKEREAEAKAKAEREAAEQKIQAEKEKREALEKEIADRKAAEEKTAEAELSKGDSDKVKDLISDLEKLKVKYVFKSKKNKEMYSNVCNLLTKIQSFINQ